MKKLKTWYTGSLGLALIFFGLDAILDIKFNQILAALLIAIGGYFFISSFTALNKPKDKNGKDSTE